MAPELKLITLPRSRGRLLARVPTRQSYPTLMLQGSIEKTCCAYFMIPADVDAQIWIVFNPMQKTFANKAAFVQFNIVNRKKD